MTCNAAASLIVQCLSMRGTWILSEPGDFAILLRETEYQVLYKQWTPYLSNY